MAIPILAGFAAGEKVSATKLTQHTKEAFEEAVYYKPFCHMQNASAQSHSSGTTPTYVNLGTVVEDTDGMASPGTNRIIIKTAGLYRVNFQAVWTPNASGGRGMFLWRNGSTIAATIGPPTPSASLTTSFSGTKTVRLAVNDFLQIGGWQTSGGSLSYDVTNGGCYLQAEWISL